MQTHRRLIDARRLVEVKQARRENTNERGDDQITLVVNDIPVFLKINPITQALRLRQTALCVYATIRISTTLAGRSGDGSPTLPTPRRGKGTSPDVYSQKWPAKVPR